MTISAPVDADAAAAASVRPVRGLTPLILAFAAFNVLAIVLSVIGFTFTQTAGGLAIFFPQASGLFPSAYDDYTGRGDLWWVIMAVAVIVTVVGALRATPGRRLIGAFRAMTICGFAVGVFFVVVGIVLVLL
ncbi:hypothetical protein ACFQRL_13085 [Microbacterium fluvii]|uniref:Uncharacterized protein n=1 Tax=Microbacterium fluvii TaxID=415215 RepID=A0ABW2HJ88_9MICO|nr:hypothetical protein [Microbacterium fluvii]MCU4673530.1 hypothetical protein [Microbacterium fluvii]